MRWTTCWVLFGLLGCSLSAKDGGSIVGDTDTDTDVDGAGSDGTDGPGETETDACELPTSSPLDTIEFTVRNLTDAPVFLDDDCQADLVFDLDGVSLTSSGDECDSEALKAVQCVGGDCFSALVRIEPGATFSLSLQPRTFEAVDISACGFECEPGDVAPGFDECVIAHPPAQQQLPIALRWYAAGELCTTPDCACDAEYQDGVCYIDGSPEGEPTELAATLDLETLAPVDFVIE